MSGTRLHGRHVGAEGDVSVFSFHAVKNLPTADAGMICFPDAESDAAVRHWTWLGIDKDTFARTQSDSTYKWHYQVEHVGFKYHGNSIMAGIGLVSLKYLDADNAYRRQLAAWYDERSGGRRGHRARAGGAGLRIGPPPVSGDGRSPRRGHGRRSTRPRSIPASTTATTRCTRCTPISRRVPRAARQRARHLAADAPAARSRRRGSRVRHAARAHRVAQLPS